MFDWDMIGQVPKAYNSSTDMYEEFMNGYNKDLQNKKQSFTPAHKNTFNKKRGVLDRIFDSLQVGQYATMGAMKGAIDGDKNTGIIDGFIGGLKAGNPFGAGYEEGETSFSDVLKEGGWQDDSVTSRVLRGTIGLAGDIFLDPLTYLNPLASAGKVIKGTGKVSKAKGGISTLKEMSYDDAKKVVDSFYKATGRDINKIDVTAYKKEIEGLQASFNSKVFKIKEGGEDFQFGMKNVPFSSKIKMGDKSLASFNRVISNSDKLREVGDKTVAPYFNAATSRLNKTAALKKFQKYSDLRTMADEDIVKAGTQFYLSRNIKGFDPIKVSKDMHTFTEVNKMNKFWEEMSPEQRRAFVDWYDEGGYKTWLDKERANADSFDKVRGSNEATSKVEASAKNVEEMINAVKESTPRPYSNRNIGKTVRGGKLRQAIKAINDYELTLNLRDAKHSDDGVVPKVNDIIKKEKPVEPPVDLRRAFIGERYGTGRYRSLNKWADLEDITKEVKDSVKGIDTVKGSDWLDDLIDQGMYDDYIRSHLIKENPEFLPEDLRYAIENDTLNKSKMDRLRPDDNDYERLQSAFSDNQGFDRYSSGINTSTNALLREIPVEEYRQYYKTGGVYKNDINKNYITEMAEGDSSWLPSKSDKTTWDDKFNDAKLNFDKAYFQDRDKLISDLNNSLFGGEEVLDGYMNDDFINHYIKILKSGKTFDIIDATEDLMGAVDAKNVSNIPLFTKSRIKAGKRMMRDGLKFYHPNGYITKVDLPDRTAYVTIPVEMRKHAKETSKQIEYTSIPSIARKIHLALLDGYGSKSASGSTYVKDNLNLLKYDLDKLREAWKILNQSDKLSRTAENLPIINENNKLVKELFDSTKTINKSSDKKIDKNVLKFYAGNINRELEEFKDVLSNLQSYIAMANRHINDLGFPKKIKVQGVDGEVFETSSQIYKIGVLAEVNPKLYSDLYELTNDEFNKIYNFVHGTKKGMNFEDSMIDPDFIGNQKLMAEGMEGKYRPTQKETEELNSFPKDNFMHGDSIIPDLVTGEAPEYAGAVSPQMRFAMEETWFDNMLMYMKYSNKGKMSDKIKYGKIYSDDEFYSPGGTYMKLFGSNSPFLPKQARKKYTYKDTPYEEIMAMNREADKLYERVIRSINKASPEEVEKLLATHKKDKDATHFINMVVKRNAENARQFPKTPFSTLGYTGDDLYIKSHLVTNAAVESAELYDDLANVFKKMTGSVELTDEAKGFIKSVKDVGEQQADVKQYNRFSKTEKRLEKPEPKSLEKPISTVTVEEVKRATATLNEKERDIFVGLAELISENMKKVGYEEVKAGRLKKEQFDALSDMYIHRMLTDDAKAFMLRELSKERPATGGFNPSAAATGYRKAFDKSRKMKTVTEAEKYMKSKFPDVDFDKWFEDDVMKIMTSRMMASNNLLYNDEMVNAVKTMVGKAYKAGEPAMDGYIPTISYVQLNDALNKISGISNRFSTDVIIDASKQKELLKYIGLDSNLFTANMAYLELTPLQASKIQKLFDAYPELGKKSNKMPEMWQMEKEMFQYLNRESQIQKRMHMHEFLKTYDKYLSIFKMWNTSINPGFHIQNAVSNTFQIFMSNGAAMLNPRRYRQAIDIYKGKSPNKLVKLGDIELSYDQIKAIAEQYGVLDKTFFQYDLRKGVEDGGALKKFKVPGKVDPTDVNEFVPYQKGTEVGSAVEGTHRLVLFIDCLENGQTIEEAVETVYKFLFDYSDLTSFEKETMKRAIPFYTFMRKNIPLQLGHILTHPELYRDTSKIMNAIEEWSGEDRVPESERNEWREDSIQLPFKLKGEPFGIDVEFPYQQIEKIRPNRLLGQTSPLLKAPIEAATGKYLYTGMDIKSPLDYLSNQLYPTKSINLASQKEGLNKDLYVLSQLLGLPVTTL